VLQCVAVCCSVLQCVAVCCSVLQCDVWLERPHPHWQFCARLYGDNIVNFAPYYEMAISKLSGMLQVSRKHSATHCNTLQHAARHSFASNCQGCCGCPETHSCLWTKILAKKIPDELPRNCPLIIWREMIGWAAVALSDMASFHMNESCLTWMWHVSHEWVMSHMNESCLTWMSHVSYEWVMSHMNQSCLIWISHVSYEWVILHEWLRVLRVHTSDMAPEDLAQYRNSLTM